MCEYSKVRVIFKETDKEQNIYVLGIFLSESKIRNKLKSMANKAVLKNIANQKL